MSCVANDNNGAMPAAQISPVTIMCTDSTFFLGGSIQFHLVNAYSDGTRRTVTLTPFQLEASAVTVDDFHRFVEATS